MTTYAMILALLAFPILCCLASSASAQSPAPSSIISATGLSSLPDAEAAGTEAARKAQAKLAGKAPKLVLVYDNVSDKAALLKGVSSIFPAELIYGCSAYAPITEDGNEGKVGVLALSGDIQATAAMASAAKGHDVCGKEIGEQLKAASTASAKAKLLVIFGNCHIPTNAKLVAGAQSVLGESFPIVGGAADGDKPVYFQGKVQKNTNVGIILAGNFTARYSFQGNKGEGADVAIKTAGLAAQETVGNDKDKVLLVMAFDCGGRRGWLGNQVAKELAAMQEITAKLPLFGWYGSGEMGMRDGKAAGEGYHLSMCTLMKAGD